MTVPASPQSIVAGPRSSPGVTAQSMPAAVSISSICAPSARSAFAINCVSRACKGLRIRLGPSANADRTRARFVADLEPGTTTTPVMGASAKGADQRSAVMG